MNDRLLEAIYEAAHELWTETTGNDERELQIVIQAHVAPVFADIQRENAELRVLLHDIEWSNWSTLMSCMKCPECDEPEPGPHLACCRLAKALAPVEESHERPIA